MSSPPSSPAFHRQGSMRRYRSSSSLGPPERLSASLRRAASLPPFSPPSAAGSMGTAVAWNCWMQTLSASISYIGAAHRHHPHSSWRRSSAPVWRKRRSRATLTAFPVIRHWMKHALFSWKRSPGPRASRDGSAIDCAPSSPCRPPCTECRHDGPLPLPAGLNSQKPLPIFVWRRRREANIEPPWNGGKPSFWRPLLLRLQSRQPKKGLRKNEERGGVSLAVPARTPPEQKKICTFSSVNKQFDFSFSLMLTLNGKYCRRCYIP